MASKYGSSLMDDFAEFGTNLKFNTALEEWMEDHCDGFEEAEFGKEQELVWGNVYSQYIEWIETHLNKFCEDHDCTQEEVFEELKKCMKSEKSEFMPLFMQNTEYKFFLDQMRHFANRKRTQKLADIAAEEDSGLVNFSGTWVVDQSHDHKESASEYLEAANCPWIFRKIFLHAASSTYLKVHIEQDGEKSIRFCYRFKFFGGTDMLVFFGKEVSTKNIWKKETKAIVTLDKDKDMLHINVTKSPPNHPEGSKTWSTWKFADRHQNSLVYKKHLQLKSGEHFIHEQHFIREEKKSTKRSGK